MLDVSEAFLAMLPKGHRVGFVAEVWSREQKLGVLSIRDGSVTANRNNSIRRSCRVSLLDKLGTMTPKVATDLLWPNGNEMRLYRGIYVDGSLDLKPLGVFRISRPQIKFDQMISINITGYDRAKTVSRAKLLNSKLVKNKLVHNAIHDLIDERMPGLTYDFEASAFTIPDTSLEVSADPWVASTNWAESGGMELFFSVDGDPTLRDIPDTTINAPVATYTDGEGSTVLGVSTDIDEETAHNGFIVASTKGNFRAEAWDLDPRSPTYRYGSYGEFPAPVVQTDVANQAQLQAMANGLLRNRIGFLQSVTIDAIPDPSKEPSDVVLLNSERWGFDNMAAVIQSIDMPADVEGRMKLNLGTRSIIG